MTICFELYNFQLKTHPLASVDRPALPVGKELWRRSNLMIKVTDCRAALAMTNKKAPSLG
jgi:hypothetical protein